MIGGARIENTNLTGELKVSTNAENVICLAVGNRASCRIGYRSLTQVGKLNNSGGQPYSCPSFLALDQILNYPIDVPVQFLHIERLLLPRRCE